MNTNNQLATKPAFAVNLPDNAPIIGIDLHDMNQVLSWRDIMPSNYWSLDLLEEKVESLGGNPVLTPKEISFETILDPELPDDSPKQDLSPKIVLRFVEPSPALAFNKSRCMIATEITGTPDPRLWADRLPRIELYEGVYRKLSNSLQVLFRRAPVENTPTDPAPVAGNGTDSISDLNEELFG